MTKPQIREITTEELRGQAPDVLIDVRDPDEQRAGVIAGARLIPRATLEARIAEEVPRRDTALVVYCASGTRSARAAELLAGLGYTNVRSLSGGLDAWEKAGGAVERSASSPAQHRRYARHVRLAEVGEAGQAKLLSARVLVVGVGGLGSPCALYLAAAGVGTLGIVDDDVVDESNLQRQIIHATSRIGAPKVESAAHTLDALNPDVRVVRHRLRVGVDNVRALLADYDLVVDGSDNFATRYLINDAALAARKPVVHGAIFKFEGQASVFLPGGGPCYRCLFPEPPPPESIPSCSEAGVLGVLPGIIGTVQATEVVKLILGIGAPLVGRLLVYDALAMTFRELAVPRDPRCPACG